MLPDAAFLHLTTASEGFYSGRPSSEPIRRVLDTGAGALFKHPLATGLSQPSNQSKVDANIHRTLGAAGIFRFTRLPPRICVILRPLNDTLRGVGGDPPQEGGVGGRKPSLFSRTCSNAPDQGSADIT